MATRNDHTFAGDNGLDVRGYDSTGAQDGVKVIRSKFVLRSLGEEAPPANKNLLPQTDCIFHLLHAMERYSQP